jgi:predicted acylesterase/phospholipase RssA
MADGTIGLTLSGGGFRATLFHIGVVRYLRETRLLPRVKRICSVSGGSVLAAHLALYWDDYNGTEERFSMRVAEILRCVRYDVRGRVIRRLPSGCPSICSGLAVGRTFLLERQYKASLFGERLMADLQPSPELHIIAASLTGAPPLLVQPRRLFRTGTYSRRATGSRWPAWWLPRPPSRPLPAAPGRSEAVALPPARWSPSTSPTAASTTTSA